MLRKMRALAGSVGEAVRQGARSTTAADAVRAALAPPDPGLADVDPARAAAVAVAERERRDAARVPYRAPGATPAIVTRLRVGRRDADDAAAQLATARPELVFGAYRSPDRLRPARDEAPKEWVVIHAPAAMTRAPAAPPARVELEARHAWVARAWGEPWPLDEEVAALYLERSGLPPERCLGVHRMTRWHNRGEDDGDPETRGVRILHLPDPVAERAHDDLRRERPVAWPAGSTGPAYVELLWWGAIREAVRPRSDKPAPHPNPAPLLPADPEELLCAYLELVGIRPSDCWGVGVGLSRRVPEDAGRRPCTERWHLADLVSLLYRDRPEYAEGRARFARYVSERLRVSLDHPLPGGETPPLARGGAVDAAIDHADHVEPGFLWVADQGGRPPYC